MMQGQAPVLLSAESGQPACRLAFRISAANPPADSAAAVPPGGDQPGAGPRGDAVPDPRRWLILAVIALAQLMIVLDATIVNIALPSAQRDLHFSTVDRQWIVTAYALAFGSLLLLGGKVSSLLGRKVTFISGLIGFAAASAVGGAATSFGMLVAAGIATIGAPR